MLVTDRAAAWLHGVDILARSALTQAPPLDVAYGDYGSLAPLGDPRSESPEESAVRLSWYDAGLPHPELQHWTFSDTGVALYDLARRSWRRDHSGWHTDSFTKHGVYPRHAYPVLQLQAGYALARRQARLWTPRRRTDSTARSARYWVTR